MNFILNLIWLLLGGLCIALEYAVAGLFMCITIIGIPFGLQAWKMARLAVWPFGSVVVDDGWPSGCLAGLMNVLWWIVGGFGIVLTHLAWGIALCITVIGIPFGLQHFKLMRLALLPFGNCVGDSCG